MDPVEQTQKFLLVFHPMLVHFPVALYFFEFALLTVWIVKRDEVFLRFAKISFFLGFTISFPAMFAGYQDAGASLKHIFAHELIKDHFLAAITLLVFCCIHALLWIKLKSDHPRFKVIQLAGSLLICIAVMAAGYFGGQLVYG
ncbi:MAG: DUF2231 domain-containing protein [Candidatus Omnitrophica bacterium]|nr:DUF2231 domain-containing protein [Candidatus Omnitrophota bacterium]